MMSWGLVMTPANQPLDERYFVWLVSRVADPNIDSPELTYWKLLRLLFTKEFTWSIQMDENRAEDGKQLREEFMRDLYLDEVDENWMDLGCSMLELMIGLSRRLAWEADGEAHFWFWKLVENLGLHQYSDDRRLMRTRINAVLDSVIDRTYAPNGEGGLFPLRNPKKDQRQVELWYQLSEYVLEQS
jgi:hypothetical protein